jgi:hypothetical protein
MKSPLLEETVPRVPCRVGDVADTETPGSGRFWESVTRPEMVPVVL